MNTLNFDGKDYDPPELARVLKDTANGMPDTNDRELLFDGKAWANLLINAAVSSPAAAEVGEVVGKLLVDTDAETRSLAVSLQFKHKIASGAATLAAMHALERRGEDDAVATLASALSDLIAAGRFAYTTELRGFAEHLGAKKELMRVFLRHDRDWTLANLQTLVGGDAAQATSLLAVGLGTNKAEIEDIAKDLLPAMSALPAQVSDAVKGFIQRHT